MPRRYNELLEADIQKMLEAGITVTVSHVWCFLVVFDAERDGKPKFYVDYRVLNLVIRAERWPFPEIEEIYDKLEGNRVLTTLDLFSRYWHIRKEEKC